MTTVRKELLKGFYNVFKVIVTMYFFLTLAFMAMSIYVHNFGSRSQATVLEISNAKLDLKYKDEMVVVPNSHLRKYSKGEELTIVFFAGQIIEDNTLAIYLRVFMV